MSLEKLDSPGEIAFIHQLPGSSSEAAFELAPRSREARLVRRHVNLGGHADVPASAALGWLPRAGILIAKLSGAVPPPFWAVHDNLEREYALRLEANPIMAGASL